MGLAALFFFQHPILEGRRHLYIVEVRQNPYIRDVGRTTTCKELSAVVECNTVDEALMPAETCVILVTLKSVKKDHVQ